MAGDEVIEVGKKNVHTGDELVYAIFADGADPVDVTVVRNGMEMTVKNVKFPTQEKDGITFGIINFRIYTEEKNFVNTVKQSFFGSINAITQVFDSIVGMITGKYGLQHISSPIGVGEVIGQAAKIGLNSLLSITVVLTMNLGIFNLIPIPGLDGGKLVFLAIEGIMRKPVPRNVEEKATVIGITVLMALVIVVAFKDVFMLILK
jgi:regulator of sigma E protease